MASRSTFLGLILSALIVAAAAGGANVLYASMEQNAAAAADMAAVDRGAATEDLLVHSSGHEQIANCSVLIC